MSITISGLASGLDVNTIIDGLVKAESVPLTVLQSRKTNLNAASSTISNIETKLASLRTAAAALADPVQFSSFTAQSTSATIVPTVSGAPSTGSYDVKVDSIATEQRTYSTKQSSSTDALGMSGTVSVQVGSGTSFDVSVDSGDSLTAIASKITKSGARVSASVLYDGKDYRIQLRGLDTGEANKVNLTETGTSLGLDDPANTFQPAANAKLHVDGIEVSRATNQIVGVIPGITFAVTKPTTSAETISIASDPAALATKINTFVKAYNDVVTAGHNAAGYGQAAASNTLLAGDASIRTMLDKLQRVIGSPVSGASGKYSTVLAVGLSSNRDGNLSLDSTKLNAAIAADPSSVSRLFVVSAASGSTGMMGAMQSTIDSMTTGKYASFQLRIDAFAKLATRCDDDTTTLQRRIDSYKTLLTNQFSALEKIMTATKIQTQALDGIKSVNSSNS